VFPSKRTSTTDPVGAAAPVGREQALQAKLPVNTTRGKRDLGPTYAIVVGTVPSVRLPASWPAARTSQAGGTAAAAKPGPIASSPQPSPSEYAIALCIDTVARGGISRTLWIGRTDSVRSLFETNAVLPDHRWSFLPDPHQHQYVGEAVTVTPSQTVKPYAFVF